MNVRTAIGVDIKRQAYKDDVQAVLDEATRAEAKIVEASPEEQGVNALVRVNEIGKRIIVMADEYVHTGAATRHEEHTGMIELGVNGLAIAIKARQSRVNASFMPWKLGHVEASWIKDGDVDSPLASQVVTSVEYDTPNIAPETFGMLNLIEQALDTAVLARNGMLPLRTAGQVQ